MSVFEKTDRSTRAPQTGSAGWLYSFIVHAAALLVLAFIAIPLSPSLLNLSVLELGSGSEESEGLFQIDATDPPTMASESEVLMPVIEPLVSLTDGVGEMAKDPRLSDAWLASTKSLDSSLLDADLVVSQKNADAMFFGTTASGRDFVFILDCSGSMRARSGGRFERAREELLSSVSKLQPEQRFYVYLFNWSTFPMFGRDDPGKLIEANGENVAKLRAWLYGIRPDSGTDPRRSMAGALLMRPDTIFLLSDGKFNRPNNSDPLRGWDATPTSVFDVVQGKDAPKIQVNTIAFEDPTSAIGMERLANMTEGQFQYVPAPDQSPQDFEDEKNAKAKLNSTTLDRKMLARKLKLVRQAKQLLRTGKVEEAKELVEGIDLDTVPESVRKRLEEINSG